MTPKEMIQSNNAKIESKRLELIDTIKQISYATTLNEFRQINILVGQIQHDMSKLYHENELINKLCEIK